MNEISVPVKLQIQNLQSLMSDLQGKLSNLKVGSAGFKNLQSVISAIGNEIDRLQVQTSKPFMSEAQFKTAERSVERLEDQIEKLGLSVSRIKFSDLNLTPQQQSDIKGFEDQLESIKTNLKMVKDAAKQEFLKTDLGQQWATIDGTAFSKSLSQITANIRSEVKKQQDELNKLQETATSYQNALKQNNKINEFLKKTNKDPISAGSMGEDLYNQLFDKLKRLKGGKNGGRKLIEEWLKNELELSPEIISKLVKNLHGEDLSAQLTAALQKMMKDNSAVIKANSTAEVDFKQKEQEVQNLINILREAGVSEQGIVVAEQALRQQFDSTKKSLSDYEQGLARAAQEHMNIDSTAAAFKSQLTSLRSTLDQTNARFLQMQRTTQSFNQMKMAITNFMGFNQVLNITKNAVREAMNHIKELDSVMNGISIVTDMTTDDLWKQVDAYSEMAQNYGVSIKGAYEVSQIYYQQGLETNDVLTLTNETLKLAKISGLDYAQTTDYMTTALRGFKMEMSDASTIVDVYSNLAANTAVSQEELAVAMSKTASSMESVGSSFEDTSAMIATMVAVTRESATNIGSAMKSIASRYGELTKDPTKLVDADGEAMAFNKVDSALQSVGISMKTVDGQFRNFTEVIVELAEKWDQLESTQQRYIATQFAGNRQQSRFLALVSNKDILKANMEVANNSEDVGTIQALKALDSIEAKTEQVRVAYQQFYTTIGMQDVWKAFLDGTKNVINTLNRLPKLFGSIPIGAIAAITSVLNLLKNGAVAILNSVAKIWINRVKDISEESKSIFSESGTTSGNSFMDKIIAAITGKTKEVQKAGQEVAEAAKAGVESVTLQQQSQSQNVQQWNENQQHSINTAASIAQTLNKKYIAQPNGSDMATMKAIEENAIRNLSIQGVIKEDQAQQAYNSTLLGQGVILKDLIQSTQQHTEAIGKEGNAVQSAGDKFKQFATNHNKLAGNLQQLSSALTMIGMLWDTSSRGGQAMAGVFSTAAGAVSLFSAALKIADTTTKTIPWMAIASGIIAVINGISLVIETPTERLERLNKVAEELSNKAKEVKANYNVLNRSIEKLEELKDKRYESAEAAEEYQTAVDELAEKFPEMIAGFDEAGNVIVDMTNKESLLTKAREKSANAAVKAARAEYNRITELNQQNKGKVHDSGEKLVENLVNVPLGEKNVTTEYSTVLSEAQDQLNDIINGLEGSQWENLKANYARATSSASSNSTLSGELIKQYQKAISDLNDEKIEWIDVEELKDPLDNFQTQYFEAIKVLQNAKINNNYETKEVQEAVNKIKTLFTSELPDYLTEEQVEPFLKQINEFNNLFGDFIESDSLRLPQIRILAQDWQEQIQAEYINISSAATTLVSKALAQTALDKNIDVTKDTAFLEINNEKHYKESMEDFISNLDESKLELFNKMFEDPSTYSIVDFKSEFSSITGFEDILPILISYYSTGIESIQKRLNAKLSSSLKKGPNEKNEYDKLKLEDLNGNIFYERLFKIYNEEENNLAGIDEEYLTKTLNKYDLLVSNGLNDAANTFGEQALSIWEIVSSAPRDIQSQLWKLILDNGITTLEGIQKIQEGIERNSDLKNYTENYTNDEGLGINDALTGISETMVANIASMSQALLAEAQEEVEKNSKFLGKASQQMSSKEASSLMDYINNLGLTDETGKLLQINYDDFVPIGNKLELQYNKFNAVQAAYEKYLTTRLEPVDQAIKKSLDLLEKNEDGTLKVGDIESILNTKKAEDEDLKNFLLSQKIDVENLKINEEGYYTFEAQEIIKAALTTSANTYNDIVKAYELLIATFTQDSKWAQGIYEFDGKKYGREELIKLANDNFIPKEETDSRSAKEYINSHYNTFVTDVLKKGFENINMDDYEGLYEPDEIKKDLTGSYVDFINKYGDFLGLSVEELNDLIGEAIEKDKAPLDGAARKALEKVDFYKDINGSLKGVADYDTIQELADALKVSVNDLLGDYIRQLDQYEIKLDNQKLSTALNHNTELIADSINSVFNSITKYINSGLEGKLQIKDRNNFIAQLKELGITGIDKIDFTETQDGLKLSYQAAIHLYDELSKIDSIQSRIIFNDLNKSLKESNEHYRTTRDILEHIKDLRTQIKNLEGTKNTTKIEQYKEELALAEKIVQVRTVTEDDSYKFMDNKLEGGLANAVNYFNALGNAQKTWNEAIQDAQERQKAFQEGTSSNNDFNIYLDIDKFKAIVEEFNRLAGQSGKEIEFLGHKLNGELSSASELIQAGLNTVVFDGDSAKINLSELGVSLLDGGKLLNKNSQEAVREFAKSQITIIDGLIGITDTIIAFEEIGKIDVNENGQLDVGEVFKTKDGYGITDQLNDQLTKLIGNEGTAKVLSNIKLSTGTLLDLFKAATNGEKSLQKALEELGLSREEFIKLLEVLAKERDWGDKNGADLTQLLEQVIGETGIMTYDASNTKQVIKIKGKPNIVIDWEQDSTKQALEQFNSEETEGKRKKLLIQALRNYESTNGLSVTNVDSSNQLMAVLRYKGIVTDVKVDSKTSEVTMTYNGKEYKGESQQKVLQQALLAEGGAQIIAEDTDSKQLMGAITFGSAAIRMELGNNGKITYSLDVGNGKSISGSSLDAIKEQYINYVLKSDTTKTQQEVELDWNTKINMNSSVVGEISQGIRDALKEIGANLDTPLITITPKETKIRIPEGQEPSVEDTETVPTEVNAPKERETITINYSKLAAMLKVAGVQEDKIQPILDELNSKWKKNGDTPIEITYKSLEAALKNNEVNDTVLPNIKRLWAAWHDPSYSKVVVNVDTLKAQLIKQGFTEDQVSAAIKVAKTDWQDEGGKSVEIKPELLTAAAPSNTNVSAVSSAISAAQEQWKKDGESPVDVNPNLNIITTKTIKDENGEEIEVSIVDQLANVIGSLDSNLTPEQKTAVITGLMMTLSQIKDLSEEDQEKLQTVITTAANKLNISPDILRLNLTAAKLAIGQIEEDKDMNAATKASLENWISQQLTEAGLTGNTTLAELIITGYTGKEIDKENFNPDVGQIDEEFKGSGTLINIALKWEKESKFGYLNLPTEVGKAGNSFTATGDLAYLYLTLLQKSKEQNGTSVILNDDGTITLTKDVQSAEGNVQEITLRPSKDGIYTLDITELDEFGASIPGSQKTITITGDINGSGTLASLILDPPIESGNISLQKDKDGKTSITISTVDEAKGEVTTLTITNIPNISNVTGTVSEAQVSADTAHLTIKKLDANGNEIESTEIDIPANVLFGGQKQSLLDYLTSITNDQKVIDLLGQFDDDQIQKALDAIGPRTIKINGESDYDWNSPYGEEGYTVTTGERTFGGNPGDYVAAQQMEKYWLWPTYTGGSSNAQEAALKKASELKQLTDAAIALYNQAQNDKTVVEKIISSLENINTENVDTVSKTLKELNTTQIEKIKQYSDTINTTPAFNARAYINSIDPSRAQAAQAALNSITGNVAIDVQFNVGIDRPAEATGNIVGARLNGQNINYSPYSVNTKINKSYAKGSRRTLMGELGPELVVSGGRYYVVGQNGAEMVDLDPDAIVFNHLQTKKLLSTGHAGRGKPVTNERVATSLATGNVGPAMASASEIRETLKTMRDMWKTMLESSLRALGSQAGLNTKLSNKKNNGGNGNGNNDKPNTIDAGYIADLERWYNLLRQIDKLEKDINYQEQLRSKIESDRAINGKALYESQKQSLKEIEEEVIARHQLVVLQKSYYDKRREELTESPFGKIFTFNEDGLMQYNDQGLMPNGERGGLAALAKLNATNPDNSSVFTPREQYNLLVEWGYGDLLKYDNSGKLIEFTDEKGNPREEGYVEAVQSFWDQADGIKEELDSLYDSYRDQQEQILAADQKRNEILQNIVNNQLAVEDKVYKALVDLKETEIENAEKEKDALQKSTDEFIDGLNSQLNKEREMYKNNQEEVELTKLRRQLAILRRSGGSASQIRGLQDQISAKEQDQYFNAQQQQIDAVKEASDLQIKKMDQQITIMRETLEYQKAQGLLYGEVSKIMSGSAESINSFITTFDKDWKTYSATKWQEEYNLLNSSTTQWTSYLQDETGYRKTASGTLVSVKEAIEDKEGKGYSWRVYDEAMYNLFGEDWSEVRGQVKSIYEGHYGETADPNFAATKATETQEVQNLITGDDNTIYLNPEGDGDIFKQSEDDDYLGDNGGSSNYGNSSYSTPSVKTPEKEDTPPENKEKIVLQLDKEYSYDEEKHWKNRLVKQGNREYTERIYEGPHNEANRVPYYGELWTQCSVCKKLISIIPGGMTIAQPPVQIGDYDSEPNSSLSGTYKTSYPNQAIYDDGTVYHRNSTDSKGTIKVHHVDMNGNSLVKKVYPETFTQGRTIKGNDVKRIFNNYVYDHSEPSSITVVGGQTSQMFCYYRKLQVASATGKPKPTEQDSVHSIMGLSTGGMVDYTGLAMLHGSKTRPEAVLNADETKMWREKILSGHSNSLTNQLLNFQNLVNGLSLNLSGVNNTTNEGSVNIERIEFNMNASIANDYDAKRAGQNAFEEMMKIARKNGVQSVSRR